MQIYQCPNCGRTYTEFENIYYCGTCNYRLIKQQDIKKIKHPELSERNYHVIGTLQDPTKSTPKCPTCQSTNVQKIEIGERAASVAIFGIFSKKINKSFKCKNCGYTW